MDFIKSFLKVMIPVAVVGIIFIILFFYTDGLFFDFSVHDLDKTVLPSEILEPTAAEYAAVVNEAQLLARTLVIRENLPGLSVAVAVDSAVIWAEGFGWADYQDSTKATPETKFRIGTSVQALTAAAAGLVYERGFLDLDIPVRSYVPEFPEKQWQITTRQLMANVSGIRPREDGMPGLQDEEILSRDHYSDLLQSLDAFKDDPLIFQPSTRVRHSAYAWVLVGTALQAAAGVPYTKFMSSELFGPAGMTATFPDYNDENLSNRASFYWPRMAMNPRLGIDRASKVDLSGILPAGGYLSTPADLVLFGMALMNGSLLKPETVELLRTEQKLLSGEPTGEGLGWRLENVIIDSDSTSTLIMSAPGSGVGGTTSFMIFPDHDMVIAAVTNISFVKNLDSFVIDLARIFNPK